MVIAAAVVHVFLEDAGTAISMEDIKEWLQIIDEVIEIKLQYDAACKRTCYSVEFRKPASAQQAVQYLSGSRFKNCVVTIRSRFFSAMEADTTTATAITSRVPSVSASSAVPGNDTSFSTRKRCRETAALPFNHLLPDDLQMDQVLVDQLANASVTEGFEKVEAFWSTLKSYQEELLATRQSISTVREELDATDARLAKLLHVKLSAPAADGHANSNTGAYVDVAVASTAVYSLAARRCVSHQRGIPVDAYTPRSVVTFVTSSFGPIAFCSVTAHQCEFYLVLKFVFLADEERFLAASNGSGSSNGASSKGLASRTEKEKALLNLMWSSIDFSITPRDFAALSPAEATRLQTARQRLS